MCVSGCQDEDSEAVLAADFEIGHFIRERIVPRAVLYFTGEAIEDDDDDVGTRLFLFFCCFLCGYRGCALCNICFSPLQYDEEGEEADDEVCLSIQSMLSRKTRNSSIDRTYCLILCFLISCQQLIQACKVFTCCRNSLFWNP